MLLKDTDWRQGSILTHDSSLALGLFKKDIYNKQAIVISHDCDLQNNKEEEVEVIISTKISINDPSYTAARNVRCLHIAFQSSQSSELIFIELQHSGRKSISKKIFHDLARLEANLKAEEKRTLKQWLAARYGRPEFPNAFESRLSNKKFHEKLIKLFKPINKYLIGIFFDLGEDRSKELPNGDPYFLRISLVYESSGGLLAREIVEKSAANVKELFYITFGLPNIATELVLESCEAIADTHFSFADIRRTDQWWRYDYISLQESPASPIKPIGITSV